MTSNQHERQKHRGRDGRYDKVFPCYRCGKSAGVDYFSGPFVDRADERGEDWSDEMLCLCEPCAKHMWPMTGAECEAEVSDANWGSLPQGRKA